MKTLLILLAMALPFSVHAQSQKTEKATFAAGCFWCTEEAFEKVPGVVSAVSGYMGGSLKNPSYEQVSSGRTGHTEVVEVTYDPAKVSYEKLLDTFWLNHDPTVKDRQFCDAGSQYRPEIFFHSDEQKRLAEASKAKWDKQKPFRQPILTPVTKASAFYPAEDYHQDYYKKNALQYKFYVTGCGRYARLDSLWGSLRKLPFISWRAACRCARLSASPASLPRTSARRRAPPCPPCPTARISSCARCSPWYPSSCLRLRRRLSDRFPFRELLAWESMLP
jgi:peptide-methionine (S)-S-oxide reductase